MLENKLNGTVVIHNHGTILLANGELSLAQDDSCNCDSCDHDSCAGCCDGHEKTEPDYKALYARLYQIMVNSNQFGSLTPLITLMKNLEQREIERVSQLE